VAGFYIPFLDGSIGMVSYTSTTIWYSGIINNSNDVFEGPCRCIWNPNFFTFVKPECKMPAKNKEKVVAIIISSRKGR
jgi:hypothetical protein